MALTYATGLKSKTFKTSSTKKKFIADPSSKLGAYQRAGISKPVIIKEGETEEQAVKRSAEETSQLVSEQIKPNETATVVVTSKYIPSKEEVRASERERFQSEVTKANIKTAGDILSRSNIYPYYISPDKKKDYIVAGATATKQKVIGSGSKMVKSTGRYSAGLFPNMRSSNVDTNFVKSNRNTKPSRQPDSLSINNDFVGYSSQKTFKEQTREVEPNDVVAYPAYGLRAVGSYFGEKAGRFEYQAKQGEYFASWSGFVGSIGAGAFGFGKAVTDFGLVFADPIGAIKGISYTIKNPQETASAIGSEFIVNPSFASGNLLGVVAAPKIPGFIYSKGRLGYAALTKEYVPPEQVFSPAVLQGKQTFPLTTGPKDSLARFEAARTPEGVVVISASPKPLSGNVFTGEVKVGAGPAAKAGLEDPGLYVAPYGEGSAYFLKVLDDANYLREPPSFSLFPEFKRPTGSEVVVSAVERQPSSVLRQPGFGATEDFLVSQSGSGKAFITKRSEAAFQNLGVTGTSELEAVVPLGTQLEYLGSKQFTIVGGEAVFLKRYKPVTSGTSSSVVSTASADVNNLGLLRYSSKLSSSEFSFSPSYFVNPSSGSGVSSDIVGSSVKSSDSNVSSKPFTFEYKISYATSEKPSYGVSDVGSSVVSSSRSNRVSRSVVSSVISSSSSLSDRSSSYSIVPSRSTVSRYNNRFSSSRYYINNNRDNFNLKFPLPPSYRRSTEGGSFSVFVKKQGRFLEAGKFGNFQKALKFGRFKTATTSAASFKILSGANVVKLPSDTRYYSSKKQKGVQVERTKFRINTSGELKEITFKGLEKIKFNRGLGL